MKTSRIANHERSVHRPEACRVDSHLYRFLAHCHQSVQDLLHWHGATTSKVVDGPGLALKERQAIGPHDVSYVRKVAPCGEIAHKDLGGVHSQLDLGDLLRKVRSNKAITLAGADVIKWPHADHIQLVCSVVLVSEEVLRCLTHRIWTFRSQLDMLIDGLAIHSSAIHLC